MELFLLHVKHEFSAARALRDYQGKCANIHGHNFKLQANIQTPVTEKGYAIDFYQVKKYLTEITEKYDHIHLNEASPFDQLNPTTENIAKYLHQQLSNYLDKTTAEVISVTLWESEQFGATYPG